MSLAECSFPKRPKWFSQTNGRPGLWQTLASIFNDSVYEEAGVERALQTAFGDAELMYGATEEGCCGAKPHRIKVAVTATESTSASIFTNYNKILHEREASYTWAQIDDGRPELKTWEV